MKGNKVNAEDAAKVNITTSGFKIITNLTQTFICLLVAQNQYYIEMKTLCSVSFIVRSKVMKTDSYGNS